MEAIINIADWYASPGGTFIRVFGREKPLHVLPRYAIDKMVMQEVSYHLSIWLSTGLHRKKKAPWMALPLRIRLYKIKSLKNADAEAKEIVKFELDNREFNPYDPHGICKDHCARVYFPWIHEACLWLEGDPWRYCYNASKLCEWVSIAIAWKAALQIAVAPEATTAAA